MSRATLIKMAGRNLARNKRRNTTTAIAMACGFAAFVALGGYQNRIESILTLVSVYGNRTGHLAIYKPDGLDKFPINPELYSFNESEQATITQIIPTLSKVRYFGAALSGSGLVGNGCRTFPFLGVGYDPTLEKNVRELPDVKAINEELNIFSKGRGGWEFPAELGGIAVAEGLARLLHKPQVYDEVDKKAGADGGALDCLQADINSKIESDANVQLMTKAWNGQISAVDAEIIAHFKTGVAETNSTYMITNLDHLQRLLDTKNVASFAIFLDLPDPKLAWIQKIELEDKLEKAGIKASVYTWTDEKISPLYASTMGFIHTLVGFVGFVLAMIISFSIFNSATMTVVERSQEIGMMRSLGFTKKRVRLLFLSESLLLTGLALLFGVVIAVVSITSVNHAAIPFKPPGSAVVLVTKLLPDARTVIFATAAIIFVSLGATLIAVWSMSKQNVATLLLQVQR